MRVDEQTGERTAASTSRAWLSATKRLQPDAKKLLHEIMEAPSHADARVARERFREQFDARYPIAQARAGVV